MVASTRLRKGLDMFGEEVPTEGSNKSIGYIALARGGAVMTEALQHQDL